jgi:hypothetical protein
MVMVTRRQLLAAIGAAAVLTAVNGELLLFRREGTTATATTAGARQFLKRR